MRPITIKDIKLYPIAMPFVEPLRTSFGMEPYKSAVIIEVITEDGVSGWGEASVAPDPGYTGETMGTAYHILKHYLTRLVIGQTLEHPAAVRALMAPVRDHHHARSGLDGAVWDAFARANDMRFADLLSQETGTPSIGRAVVGVSIGIQPDIDATLAIIRKRLDEGYRRIKLKIKPGWDVELARGVRAELPDIMMMLDANSAYTLNDAEHLAKLDEFDLLMIEQPLSHDDIYEHSRLQPMIQTPICLDESVKNSSDLLLALEVGAIKILNLKPARVGGYTESIEMVNICASHELPLWIGGMLETGIGRAANLALASLPAVTLPCDISATNRYFTEDIAEPVFTLNDDSTISVPDGYGIGVEVQRDRIEAAVALWQERSEYPLG